MSLLALIGMSCSTVLLLIVAPRVLRERKQKGARSHPQAPGTRMRGRS